MGYLYLSVISSGVLNLSVFGLKFHYRSFVPQYMYISTIFKLPTAFCSWVITLNGRTNGRTIKVQCAIFAIVHLL